MAADNRPSWDEYFMKMANDVATRTPPSEPLLEHGGPRHPPRRTKGTTMAADNRPSWDEYFMKMANDVATRTTCLRRGVGAVIVKDRRILATG